jgi:hypothetical protein
MPSLFSSRKSHEFGILTNVHMHSDYFTQHPCKQTEFDKLYQYSKPQKQGIYASTSASAVC